MIPRLKRCLFLLPFFIGIFFSVGNVYAQGNCPVCHGTGLCQTCHGSGIMGYRYFNHGQVQQPLGCTSCGGWNGAYYNAGVRAGSGRCSNCGGTGNVAVAGPTAEEIKAKEDAEKAAAIEAAAAVKRERLAAEKRARDVAEKKRRDDEAKFVAERNAILHRTKDESTGFGLKDENSGLGLKASENNTSALGLKAGKHEKLMAGENNDAEKMASLPARDKKYMWDADHIVVPPPAWESMLEQRVDELRVGQNGSKYLMLVNDMLVVAYDIQVSPKTPQQVALVAGFKVLLIASKSTIAAQDEAEVLVFKQNANYERVLYLLKDKARSAELIAAIRSVKAKTPPPAGVSEEVMKLARSLQNRDEGCSDIHFAMSAMLSKEAKGAFFETAKMEGIETLNTGLRGIVGSSVEKGLKSLRYTNEQIELGEDYIAHNRTKNPWMTAQYEKRVERMDKQMEKLLKPVDATHESISGFIDAFEKYKGNKKGVE